MNKIRFIGRHEFIVTVRRRAFIILTLAFPIVGILGILVSQAVSGISKPPAETPKIGYVDLTGGFSSFTIVDNVTLTRYATSDAARQALLGKDIKEYFIVPSDYLSTGIIQRFTLSRELEPNSQTQQVIRDFLLNNLLKGVNDPAVLARVKAPFNLQSVLLTTTGEAAPNQGGGAAFLVPYFFSLLLVMSIFISSGYLLQGLGEEKENRVMEILLSSVSPGQLLAGKVLGLGTAGLLQVAVWLLSARFISGMASNQFSAIIGSIQIPPEMLALGLIYFILGYLLFAVLMAGVGAISPTAREGQQMSALFTIWAVLPLFFITFIIENPDHVLAHVLSIIPITAPLAMIMRAGLTNIPIWELAASIAVMVATIAGCFVLATKLFRTYLLMYGKRPDISQIFKSFRNA